MPPTEKENSTRQKTLHDLALGKPTAEAKPPQPNETETPKAAESPKTDSKAMGNTALDPKAKAG